MDATTGQYVPDYYCSSSTDLSLSASVDLSYVVLNEVWFADKAGKVTLGMGYRFRRPVDPFARVGVLFPSGRSAVGANLDLGPGFVHMGVTWGLDLVRVLRR
jgi:hypothetical protein